VAAGVASGAALCGAEAEADSVAWVAGAADGTDCVADSPPLTGAVTWAEPAVGVALLFIGAAGAASLTGA